MPCWSPEASDCGLCIHQPLSPAKWKRREKKSSVKSYPLGREVQKTLIFCKCQMWNLLQVLLYKPRDLWTALETTKSCAFPDTTSHQLKRPCAYLLPCCCNTHNNRCAPALKVVGISDVCFILVHRGHTKESPYGSTPKRPSSLRHFQCTQNCSQHHHPWGQQEPVELVSHGPLDSRIQ